MCLHSGRVSIYTLTELFSSEGAFRTSVALAMQQSRLYMYMTCRDLGRPLKGSLCEQSHKMLFNVVVTEAVSN